MDSTFGLPGLLRCSGRSFPLIYARLYSHREASDETGFSGLEREDLIILLVLV